MATDGRTTSRQSRQPKPTTERTVAGLDAAAAGAHASASRRVPNSPQAGRAAQAAKGFGALGQVFDVAEMQRGYEADLRTMPWDEAAAKNFGGGGLKMLGGGMGAGVGGVAGGAIGAPGGPLAVAGAAAGGVAGAGLGARAMQPLADRVLPAYLAVKRASKMTVEEAQQLARMYAALNNPGYYLSQRRPPFG